MNYEIEKIASIIESECKGDVININNDIFINDLLFDSRLLVSPENTLFFALKGQRNDGNKYIKELYNKGVRSFVVDNSTSSNTISSCNKATFFVVEDTLEALRK